MRALLRTSLVKVQCCPLDSRNEPEKDAAAALDARVAYQAAVGRMVARLRPKDLEALADLVLARSGWAHVAKLGGATEGIGVEVGNPATAKVAFVQVESEARQAELDDYVSGSGSGATAITA